MESWLLLTDHPLIGTKTSIAPSRAGAEGALRAYAVEAGAEADLLEGPIEEIIEQLGGIEHDVRVFRFENSAGVGTQILPDPEILPE